MRSPILTTTIDPVEDNGNILFSMIQGEQLEFELSLSFLANASSSYTYEAVLMEAKNVYGDLTIPTEARPGGVNVTLPVRVLIDRGTWSAAGSYNREDFVLYNSVYYKLLAGAARVDATLPPNDPLWAIHSPNKVYIQMPSELTLAPVWSVQPTLVAPIYGFFEFRVTEPVTAAVAPVRHG